METKNKTVLMTVIDDILGDIMWAERNGMLISLKEAIARSIAGGSNGNIEALSRDELIGAYTAFQIRKQQFTNNTKEMTNAKIAECLKLFIFDTAREQMAALEESVSVDSAIEKKFKVA
ncbi:MAG: hypothetical protein FWD15_01175 [Alphaproteobacteria bacterium]|nr:hypothetical protein [Alphaproteobacteria bacterium]